MMPHLSLFLRTMPLICRANNNDIFIYIWHDEIFASASLFLITFWEYFRPWRDAYTPICHQEFPLHAALLFDNIFRRYAAFRAWWAIIFRHWYYVLMIYRFRFERTYSRRSSFDSSILHMQHEVSILSLLMPIISRLRDAYFAASQPRAPAMRFLSRTLVVSSARFLASFWYQLHNIIS